MISSSLVESQQVNSSLSLAEARRLAVNSAETVYLKDLLSEKRGKLKDTADAAGITTRQLNKLMNKYGLRKEDYK